MKKRVLALVALVVFAAASVFASSSEVYYTRAGMYTYYRIDTLKDSEFEFYFSIDSCTDIEEYIRINFPSNIVSPTLGKIRISSSAGEHVIAMEGSIQPGDKGKYLVFTVGKDDGEKASKILRGENIEVVVIEKDGNVIELNPHQEGLNLIGQIHGDYNE